MQHHVSTQSRYFWMSTFLKLFFAFFKLLVLFLSPLALSLHDALASLFFIKACVITPLQLYHPLNL